MSSNPHDYQDQKFDSWDDIFAFQAAKHGANYNMLKEFLKMHFSLPELLPPTYKNAKFTSYPKGDNWCSGTVGDLQFEAKHFDKGSQFGINEGRVSKLWIGNDNETLVHYDRGWDIEPSDKVKEAYEAVMHLLENAPKRF